MEEVEKKKMMGCHILVYHVYCYTLKMIMVLCVPFTIHYVYFYTFTQK